MREILFRGKRIDNGEWVEGDFIAPYFISPYQNSELYINGTYVNEKSVDGIVWCQGSLYRIAPSTVGQYTGLKDKNGKRIFEGDIIDASAEWWDASGPAGHSSPIIPVEWCEYYCGFDPFANYDCDCGVFIYANNCIVIGNIHDNPELLEK